MNTNKKLSSFNVSTNEPENLNPKQKSLCKNLDALNNIYSFCGNKNPSELYQGAVFAMRKDNQGNSDWMAQAAHSLRDIIFGVKGDGSSEEDKKRLSIQKTFFSFSQENEEIEYLVDTIYCLYSIFTNISHHFRGVGYFKKTKKRIKQLLNEEILKPEDVDRGIFTRLVEVFEDVMIKSIPAFLNVYKKIDVILLEENKDLIKNELRYYFYLADNIENYFFSKVSEDWFDWLAENSFLLLSGSKEDNKDFYKLNYLSRVAQKSPDKITSFINDTDIHKYEFKQEIINKFLWILSDKKFPVDELCKVVDKIIDDNWVKISGDLNGWWFDYDNLLQKLYKNEKYSEFLSLANVVLTIRKKNTEKTGESRFIDTNPFYFNDFKDIHIFKNISEINVEFLEESLGLTIRKLVELIQELFEKTKRGKYWEYEGFFILPSEIDFFSSNYDHSFYSSRNGFQDLLITIRNLLKRVIEINNNNKEKIIQIYEKYIKSLPKTEITWKLEIFFIDSFSGDLSSMTKGVISKIKEKDLDFIRSVEYQKLLKDKFSILKDEEKEEFVSDLIDFLGNSDKDKKYYISYGNEIFSCVYKHLNRDQIIRLKDKFGDLVSNYEPKTETFIRSGFVNPKPVEDLPSDIEELAEELKSNLSVESILKKNKSGDMFRPRSVDMAIQEDIKKRVEEYIGKAYLFFDREFLDGHYTYIYLQGIRDYLKGLKEEVKINYKKLLNLFSDIISSHNDNKFDLSEREQNFHHDWLANWGAVFDMITDIINELLKDNRGYEIINFKEDRDDFLVLIKKLLVFPDPSVGYNNKKDGLDPLNTALNSVRGKTFQSLIYLICRDSKDFTKEEKSQIKDDVKEVFEDIIDKENTYALFFEFGHYLGQVYFRDKDWTKSLFHKIFPIEPVKRGLFVASLEGYLCNNLYNDLFEDMESVYSMAIKMKSDDYTKRRYFRDVDEGLSAHLALAFVYFESFVLKSELFEDFWSKDNYNQKRQKEFISFIGKHVISRDENSIDISKINTEKIFHLWEYLLDTVSDKEVLSAFSFWINFKSNIYKDEKWVVGMIVKTIKKSGGSLDWEYNLMKSLIYLSEKYPKQAFKIINDYLRGNYINNNGQFKYSIYIDDIFEALKVIYKNTDLQKEVRVLISDLLPVGNGQFWKLAEITS